MPGAAHTANDATVESLRELHAASFGWALVCCHRDAADAEDVLQTAYAKVLAGDARFDGRSTFRTFLFGVIRLTAREQRTRAVRSVAALSRLESVRTDRPTPPDELAGRAERARVLTAALAELSARQAEVLHLVFYQGLTIEEAAGAMGVNLGTARVHYERGKARLRELLGVQGVTA